MSNPLHATRVYPRVNSWPRSSNAGLENVCQRATSITTLQTIPLPFFTDIFLGIFCSQKFSHFNFLCVCVRYSFKSRPFNCDPFSCPGPQRDAPPVLGKELTGNFVVWCAVHLGWGFCFFAEPEDEQDLQLQLCSAPPCAEGCKRLKQNIAV